MLQPGDPSAPALALAAGIALFDAVSAAAPGVATMLKWPNDLLIDGAKAGGILLERNSDRVVAGFGANLASAPELEGRSTAALPDALPPQAFAPLLAASFARSVALWRYSDAAALRSAWLARAHPEGAALSVHVSPDDMVTGEFAGIELDGALRLRVGGEILTIRAGDVSLSA